MLQEHSDAITIQIVLRLSFITTSHKNAKVVLIIVVNASQRLTALNASLAILSMKISNVFLARQDILMISLLCNAFKITQLFAINPITLITFLRNANLA